MPWFPRPVGPRAAFADLRAFLAGRSREQTLGAILAVLVTIIIVIVFFVDSSVNTETPVVPIYAESWPANRTDDEIKAQQARDQAEREAFANERQRQFQQLENKLGM